MSQIIYKERSFEAANQFLIRFILNSDESLFKLKKYLIIITKVTSLLLNSFMLNHNSSDFAEFILNFIKIDTKSYLKISDNKKKLILFILINYGFPILSEVFKFFCNSSFISLNVLYKY